jgi:hypothetical protein
LVAAFTTSLGPIIQPTRQPVIAYVLATPLTTTQLSAARAPPPASSGTGVAVDQVLVDLVGEHPQPCSAAQRPIASICSRL